MTRIPLSLSALLLALVLAACGGAGLGGDLPSAESGTPNAPPAPFEPAPAPVLWADDGCASCHGSDGGGGGGGPHIQCTSYERLDAYLRSTATSHVGGAFPALGDADLFALEAFLRTADCPAPGAGEPTNPPPSGGVPASHTESEDGTLHHPDYEKNLQTCTTCHGANLEGSAIARSCASCHGAGGIEDDEDDEDDDDDREHDDD